MSIPAPYPRDEAQRQFALHELCALDTPAEERFDRITRLAARIFDADAAVISLVDEERQWLKSAIGRDGEPFNIERESPREDAICAYTILGDDIFYVRDATVDPRFQDNPFVAGRDGLRSYAGAPLIDSGGNRLGSFCVIYKTATDLPAEKLRHLTDFAAMAVEQFEMARDFHQVSDEYAHTMRKQSERTANLELMLDAFTSESARLNFEIKGLVADADESTIFDASDCVDESARRTAALVAQIKAMSEIARDEILPQNGVFSLKRCVQNATKVTLEERERGGVCVEIPPEFSREYRGDGALIEKALGFALATMIDATGGEEVELRFSASDDGEDLQIHVRGGALDAKAFETGGAHWIPTQAARRICELCGGGVDVQASPDCVALVLHLPVLTAPDMKNHRAAA